MKKIVSILLAVLMTAAVFASCTNGNGSSGSDSSDNGSSSGSSMTSSSESSSEPAAAVSPEDIYLAIDKAFADKYPDAGSVIPNSPILADEVIAADKFGITNDLAENYYGMLAGMRTNCDMLMVVEAKEGKLEEVVAALEKAKEAQTQQFESYPVMGNDVRLEDARIVTEGNYAALLMVGIMDDTAEEFDFTGDVQLAEDVFRATIQGK